MPEAALSIVMPALNEERNIEAAIANTLAAFNEFSIPGEVVVVNDGSRDGTEALIRAVMAKDPRVRLVNHETRQGIGASFWDGVDQAHGEFVCMLPRR